MGTRSRVKLPYRVAGAAKLNLARQPCRQSEINTRGVCVVLAWKPPKPPTQLSEWFPSESLLINVGGLNHRSTIAPGKSLKSLLASKRHKKAHKKNADLFKFLKGTIIVGGPTIYSEDNAPAIFARKETRGGPLCFALPTVRLREIQRSIYKQSRRVDILASDTHLKDPGRRWLSFLPRFRSLRANR